MPKRKVSDNEDDNLSASEGASSSEAEASEDVQPPLPKSKAASNKKQTAKKDSVPANKKSKSDSKGSSSKAQVEQPTDGKVKIHSNAEGDKFIDLGKKKRAVVRSFKGVALVDIREYYGADGEEKPGKKGISLTLDQWHTLKEGSDAIDRFFAEQKKK